MTDVQIEMRFEVMRKRLAELGSCASLDVSLSNWLLPEERIILSAFIPWSIRSVLSAPLLGLKMMRGVGTRRLERLSTVVERALNHIESTESIHSNREHQQFDHDANASNRDIDPSGSSGSFCRFMNGCHRFRDVASHPLADAPLRTWLSPTDRHLPRIALDWPLRKFFTATYEELSKLKGVGPTRLDRILTLAERALCHLRGINTATLVSSTSQSNPEYDKRIAIANSSDTASSDAESLGGTEWYLYCERIRLHRLENYPLGRFARSLRDLPRTLWGEKLVTFVSQSIHQVREFPGYGPERLRRVVTIIADLGKTLASFTPETPFRIQVVPTAIRELSHWIEMTLSQRQLPTFDELQKAFLIPLIEQLEVDLDPDVADMVRRRLGADGHCQTLEEIAEEYDLTRQRIRQLTVQASDVFRVRWPEGLHLLDDFYELLREAAQTNEQVQLVSRALCLLFSLSSGSHVAQSDVFAAWEIAGKNKLTPMNARQICQWAAIEFPHVPAGTLLKWIETNSLVFDNGKGVVLYFANNDLDQLLHALYLRGSPAFLDELTDVEDNEERNLRSRVTGDVRFLEDFDKRFLPSEFCSFQRRADVWHVQLAPSTNSGEPAIGSITVEALAQLTVSGLLHAGIADATVWGVHRYANEMLEQMYHATLPLEVTPFILADMLVRVTDDFVRHMRRRRLRWDHSGIRVPVRGKRGWIGHAVAEHGVPITLTELGDLLRQYYQDYAPHVLNQLNLGAEGEDEFECKVQLVPGIPPKVPPILVPAGWQLDSQQDNVSEEIRLIVAHLINAIRSGALCRNEFDQIPWLLKLVERHSYGENIWVPVPFDNKPRRREADATRRDRAAASSKHQEQIGTQRGFDFKSDGDVERVDEWLEKFL